MRCTVYARIRGTLAYRTYFDGRPDGLNLRHEVEAASREAAARMVLADHANRAEAWDSLAIYGDGEIHVFDVERVERPVFRPVPR